MEPAYNSVESFLLLASFIRKNLGFKAVLLINKLPNIRPIIVRERFYVCLEVKVFAIIVFFILNLPMLFIAMPFRGPFIFSRSSTFCFFTIKPYVRDILVLAATNTTTAGFTDSSRMG
jgi:hypothetical protein